MISDFSQVEVFKISFQNNIGILSFISTLRAFHLQISYWRRYTGMWTKSYLRQLLEEFYLKCTKLVRLKICHLKGIFLRGPNFFLFFPYVVVGLFLCKAYKHYFLASLHFGCSQIRREIMPSKAENNWITIAKINWPVHVKAFRVNKKVKNLLFLKLCCLYI